jgi:hypothetical protein
MAKKLTAAERLVDEQVLAIIECAADHPNRWHPIGTLPASKQAEPMLEKRGAITIWPRNETVPAEEGYLTG